MKQFEVNKQTVYFTTEKPLKIFDIRGILFYSSDFVNNFNGFFSLPVGKYFTENSFKKVNKTINHFKKILLPHKERDFKHDWNKFDIIFSDNPNKCTIDHTNKKIIFDYSFKLAPLYMIDFILLHEMGHNYYRSEYNADLYAVKHMLKRGYNSSQIALCPLSVLSEKNTDRKIKVLKLLNNAKT